MNRTFSSNTRKTYILIRDFRLSKFRLLALMSTSNCWSCNDESSSTCSHCKKVVCWDCSVSKDDQRLVCNPCDLKVYSVNHRCGMNAYVPE